MPQGKGTYGSKVGRPKKEKMRELSDANKEQVALKGTGPDAPSFEVKEKKVLKILDARNRSKKTY